MPLVVCQDFAGLEADLFRRIDAVRKDRPLAAIAVVAPTGRMLSRLRRRILRSDRAFLNLHLLHHRALAERILDGQGGPGLRVAGSEILLPVLESILAGRDRTAGPITEYARRFAGARNALLGTLRDLRDAHAEPGRIGRFLGEATRHGELGDIYSAYCRAIDRLESFGFTDTAGLVEHAIGYASRSSFLAGLATLFHYGAYDLIQIHQDLLHAVQGRVPVTVMVPGAGAGPAFRYAARFLERPAMRSTGRAERVETPGGEKSLLSDRLKYLHDESAEPPPAVNGDRVEVLTAAGARLELEAVARRALRAHAGGVPLHEIGVVARTLEPYAPHLEAVFGRFGLPFVTSIGQPLLRYPVPLAFRLLIGILDDDFPRAGVIDLFRSPVFRLETLVDSGAAPRPDLWDRWSREAGVIGGREDWTVRLPAWARRQEAHLDRRSHPYAEMDDDEFERLRESLRDRIAECERLSRVIERLGREADAWSERTSWTEHAGFLADLAGRLLAGEDDPGRGPTADLAGILDRLAAQDWAERAAGAPPQAIGRAHVRRRLDGLLEEADHQPTSGKDEGIAVLDAMQARGDSFRLLFLIGLSSDQWPRRIHPDPFFPDADRRRIQDRFGIQVPVKETVHDEDRLLLALLLGSARERLILSYQRADDDGRARAHATAWREIARITAGRAESAALLEAEPGVRTVPTDPVLRARFELVSGGGEPMLAPEEAAVLAAAAAADPAAGLIAAMEAFGTLSDRVRRGGDYLRAVGRWGPADLKRDGDIGAAAPAGRPFSASRMEVLGGCALRYFFQHRLRVEELEEPGEDAVVDRGLAGTAVHAVLERIYREMRNDGEFPVRDPAAARASALQRLDRIAPEALAPLRETVEPRHRLIWSIYRKQCLASLRAFLHWDLERIHRERSVPEEPELDIEAEVEVPSRSGDRPLALRGRIDRIDRLPGAGAADRLRIADYKTSAKLEPLVETNNLLKGEKPQLAVYYFLARSRFPGDDIFEARIFGVGPDHPDPAAGDLCAPAPGAAGDRGSAETWKAIGDTLHTLAETAAAGRFPFREGRHCNWCPYRPACRRDHPPSQERVKTAQAFREYFLLSDRTKTKVWGSKP